MELQNNQVQLCYFRKYWGRCLFYPPNVAGWPGGKNWIDSSSLMFRLRIPQLMKDNETVIAISGKTDDDQQMGMMQTMAHNMSKKDRKMIGRQTGYRATVNALWPASTGMNT